MKPNPNQPFISFVASANRRGIPLTLKKEQYQLLVARDCHLCGSNVAVSVARKTPESGYIPGNVLPACFECIYAMRDRDVKVYVKHCRNVAAKMMKPAYEAADDLRPEAKSESVVATKRKKAVEVITDAPVEVVVAKAPWSAVPNRGVFVRAEVEEVSSEDEEVVEETEELDGVVETPPEKREREVRRGRVVF